MIAKLLLAALLTQAPDAGVDVGANDAPTLIDEHGLSTTIEGPVVLAVGTVCLTHLKAASVRDDLAAKNARVATLEAGSGIDWPLMLGVAGAGVVLAALAAGVGFVAGQASAKK